MRLAKYLFALAVVAIGWIWIHAESDLIRPYPTVREYDLSPSSRPAILSFPNGSVSMSGSTATINLAASGSITSTFTYLNDQINALNSSTATLTTRLDNLDSSTATIYSLIAATSTNAVRVDDSTQTKTGGLNVVGNVGIGTTNPLTKLAIGNGSIGDLALPLQFTAQPIGGTNLAYLGVNRTPGAYGALFGWDEIFGGTVVRSIGSTDTLRLMVNNVTTALTVIPSGNVGIGTTNPFMRFDVAGGSINIHTTNGLMLKSNDQSHGLRYSLADWDTSDTIDGPSLFGFAGGSLGTTSGGNRSALRWFSTGNVGIGTTIPLGRFQVTGGTFTVLDSGKVGIGTTKPSSSLEISGGSLTIRLQHSSLNNGVGSGLSVGATYFVVKPPTVPGGPPRTGIGLDDINAPLHIKGSKLDLVGLLVQYPGAYSAAGGSFISVYADSGSAVLNGNKLGGFVIGGADNSFGSIHNAIGITGWATENWTTTFGGADMVFETNKNGADRRNETMRLTGAGNLGIGTSSPLAALHTASGTILASATGNVGIGTTNPISKLHVSGVAIIGGTASGGTSDALQLDDPLASGASGLVLNNANVTKWSLRNISSDNTFRIGDTGAYRFTITQGGNVGIGTTAPRNGVRLEAWHSTASVVLLQRSDATSTADEGIGGIQFSNWSSPQAGIESHLEVGGANNNADLRFYTSADYGTVFQERMRITRDGKVGIGTTNPTHFLHVESSDAYKLTNNVWSIASDIRTKKSTATFTDGLNVLSQIKPISYVHNGSAGTVDGMGGIGISAQEIEQAAPYMIERKHRVFPSSDTLRGFDVEEVTGGFKTSVYIYNGSALPFITVNAVKELNQQLIDLKAAFCVAVPSSPLCQ